MKFRVLNTETNQYVEGHLALNQHGQVIKLTPKTGELTLLEIPYEIQFTLPLVDKHGEDVFIGDALLIKVSEINDRPFWGSNFGQFLKKHNIEETYIQITDSDRFGFDGVIFHKKGNKIVTDMDIYGVEDISEAENKPYVDSLSGDIMFLAYLKSKRITEVAYNCTSPQWEKGLN